MQIPALYSFRRCPYAIRARLAIAHSQIQIELREVELKNKPHELLTISPKGTVPVLQLDDQQILEESLDIMHWALNHPNSLKEAKPLNQQNSTDYLSLPMINENDNIFKAHLDGYKYARIKQEGEIHRKEGEVFLQKLENKLKRHPYLTGETLSVSDYAIFPFIRQFAFVDIAWFEQSDYVQLKRWLNLLLETKLFKSVMMKYAPWKAGGEPVYFPLNDTYYL